MRSGWDLVLILPLIAMGVLGLALVILWVIFVILEFVFDWLLDRLEGAMRWMTRGSPILRCGRSK